MITFILMMAYIMITGNTDDTWKPENVEIITLIILIEGSFELLFFAGAISGYVN